MRSINKVILVGHVGADPEYRQTPGGTAVAKISLATNRVTTDRDGNKKDLPPQWHRLTLFDRLAEVARDHVRKGMPLYVEGRLEYSQHTDGDNVTRYYTEIIVREFSMLGGPRQEESEPAGAGPGAAGYAGAAD